MMGTGLIQGMLHGLPYPAEFTFNQNNHAGPRLRFHLSTLNHACQVFLVIEILFVKISVTLWTKQGEIIKKIMSH